MMICRSLYTLGILLAIFGIINCRHPQRPHGEIKPHHGKAHCTLQTQLSRKSTPKHPVVLDEKGLIRSKATEKKSSVRTTVIEHGKKVTVSCLNSHFTLSYMKNVSSLHLECKSGQFFSHNSHYPTEVDKLLCSKEIKATVKRTGDCYKHGTLIEIGFDFSLEQPHTLITLCYNEHTSFTFWSQHYVLGEELENSEWSKRPTFKPDAFYPDVPVNHCYKQTTQLETLSLLVSSESLANEYIQYGNGKYLARGHLTPNNDPISAFEKSATFFYVNVSPQWQSINAGNWNALEAKVRDLAQKRQTKLTIWTGSYKILELDDVNGNPVEIWLGRDEKGNLIKKIAVNKYTWKVIYDPKTETGAAIIVINNPNIGRVAKHDIFCPDVCSELPWVTWNTKDILHGYTFCCTVSSLNKHVAYAPDLGDLPLLKNL